MPQMTLYSDQVRNRVALSGMQMTPGSRSNLFRRVQSYHKEVITWLFFSDINASDFRCRNLAWQWQVTAYKILEFPRAGIRWEKLDSNIRMLSISLHGVL